ncbi:DUF4294 domain-containing protein [Lacibacter luteus]|uniref:DUF4294 domain-containing protein n=1 Tax=Lacibacter luteus TaxID=2508719 RepID=A0A4Q1CKG9_9BACT|nr:DUF4294 domain-containing protein [Lacibacter luteus]RXK61443.1 DUF4294 domain-containing protein [Lacibacter luteus]
MAGRKHIFRLSVLICLLTVGPFVFAQSTDSVSTKKVVKVEYGPNDTVFVKAMIINGELLGGREISEVLVWGGDPKEAAKYWANWTRLRNAVYLTYPYARSAGVVMNDVNKHLENINSKAERKKYIKSREKDLRAGFTDKVTDLSIYQGRVLMKLINRQTGNNCYEIVREMKGGFTAGFYQTLMFFAGTSLKQGWNPQEEQFDKQIEEIVQEIDRMYYNYPGFTSTTKK